MAQPPPHPSRHLFPHPPFVQCVVQKFGVMSGKSGKLSSLCEFFIVFRQESTLGRQGEKKIRFKTSKTFYKSFVTLTKHSLPPCHPTWSASLRVCEYHPIQEKLTRVQTKEPFPWRPSFPILPSPPESVVQNMGLSCVVILYNASRRAWEEGLANSRTRKNGFD